MVGLERGQDRTPGEDFVLPGVRDEMKYSQRLELMSDNSTDTITFRNEPAEFALPIRRWGAFLPGEGVGGSGIHWGGLHWRNLPTDFRIRSALTERYGAKAIPDDMTITDWPLSYAELEPYYDRFDKLCGVSGQAGNLRGQTVAGGNPFEGPRSDHYPNKPVKSSPCRHDLRSRPRRASAITRSRRRSRSRAPAYRNNEGVALGACEYCGFCNRMACETNAKASANSTVCRCCARTRSSSCAPAPIVTKLNYDKQAKKVTGVLYTDLRTGEEYEQPAGIVVLSSYVFGNTQALLLAGIGEPYDPVTGKGLVGKNYCYQFEAGAEAFFENKEMNPFFGNAGMGVCIDDFNGENFDHSGLGFFGGGYFLAGQAGAAADQRARRSAWHPVLGLGLEARDGEVVSPLRAVQHAGLGLCQPQELHGPRPDLQGCVRPAAAAAHL